MKSLFTAVTCFAFSVSFAQEKAPENWPTLDPLKDKVYGVGSEEAYKTLAGKKGKKVIVAVIDSGVDTEHEDLKNVIWVNEDEIPNNGIDDDKNGYIDDVNGWSFLGGKEQDINYEATEIARIFQKGKRLYTTKDTLNLKGEDLKAFEDWKKIRITFNKELAEQQKQLIGIGVFSDYLVNVKNKNNGKLDKEAIKNYTPTNEREEKIQKRMKLIFMMGIDVAELEAQLTEGKEMLEHNIQCNTMNMDSLRTVVVGDNPNDLTERYYGCNRVKGPDAFHGTHVSGIIAASRNNGIGMNGIAENVVIMPVRAVPNGDERDKDIANAIRYAVDNGATIINMSFGKYYSPDKKLVDDAVAYARSKDVLLIHAAGNESKDNDVELSFPNRELLSGDTAKNWIQVGASSFKAGKTLIGDFSNYGQKKVDVFAPGVDLYSTVPDNNAYKTSSGTSMASPATAGAAAIIRSYYPELKAEEVRTILMKSVVTYKKKVKIPGSKKKKKVKQLCISGGFVNVNNAVKMLNK